MRHHLFRVTIKDCEVQEFRVGGSGGQRRDKVATGIRIKHRPSGAVGQATESRRQIDNKRTAFGRMGRSKEFQNWARALGAGLRPVEELVDEQMAPENLEIEYL